MRCTTPELLKQGVTIEEFSILARCNGLFVQTYRPREDLPEDQNSIVKNQVKFLATCKRPVVDYKSSKVIQHEGCLKNPYCKPTNEVDVRLSSYETFRIACIACSRRTTMVLAVNSMRKLLGQTGTGHFSPVCGYHPQSNHTVLLDIARYKYPAYWLDCKFLYNSLIPLDCDSRKRRGFMLLSKDINTQSMLCKGAYDPTAMGKTQSYLARLAGSSLRKTKSTIDEMLSGVFALNRTGSAKELTEEMCVTMCYYAHDFEKRVAGGRANFARLAADLDELGGLRKAVEGSAEGKIDPILRLLEDMCPKQASTLFSIFAMALPFETVRKLLGNAEEAWNNYRLGWLKQKSTPIYKEVLQLREIMGILSESANPHRGGKFFSSDYIREHRHVI